METREVLAQPLRNLYVIKTTIDDTQHYTLESVEPEDDPNRNGTFHVFEARFTPVAIATNLTREQVAERYKQMLIEETPRDNTFCQAPRLTTLSCYTKTPPAARQPPQDSNEK